MEEWKECKLGDLCIDNKGSYGIAASAVPYSENLYTYLRITDINDDGTLNKSDLKSVADENAEQYILQPNDIVFARTGGSTGRNYFYDGSDGVFVYAGFLIKFSIDPNKVNPKYIKYFCLSQEYKNWVYSFNTGSTRGNINAQTYANMPVILPPRSQQDLLVRTLSSLDDKIELNNKINTNLEQQAQALFKNWFVDFEPFGGKMPEEWKEVEFRDVCENITDGVHNTVVDDPNGEYLLLSCKNIKGGVLTISSSERKINKETFEKLRKRTKLAKGDILLSSVGTVGEMYLLNETPDNYEFQRSVAIIKPNTSLISPAFLYESMLLQKDTIIHSAHGAVQQCIFISDVGDFKTILPTLDVIDKFTNIIQPMLDTITANQHENQKLANIRDTLLPKLMNGEIGGYEYGI